MNRMLMLLLVVMSLTAHAGGDNKSYLVVAFADRQYVSSGIRQSADFVAISVTLSSDQKDPIQRFAEIREAKQIIQKKAGENMDIVIHTGPVTLSADPSKSSFLSSYPGGSSVATLHILVPFKEKDRDVFTCAGMIRTFLDGLTLPGKTHLQLGAIQLAVDNPEQYRAALLEKIAGDVAMTKNSLKADGRVRLSGLEGPVLVRQFDEEQVELFINYQLGMEMK